MRPYSDVAVPGLPASVAGNGDEHQAEAANVRMGGRGERSISSI